MKKTKEAKRIRRKMHIRKSVQGTADKPRVYVFKSNKFLNVGVADDVSQKVLAGGKSARNIKGAQELGKKVAADMKKKKVTTAVFDRSGYKYHGVIAEFADSLRKNGIKI